MAKRKSNRAARRIMGMPHWRSNSQFQAKERHTGMWFVTQTNSWEVFESFHLSRKAIAARRAEAQEKAL
ncbi:TPA: stationary-phase-induced ribosome-associated protein [Serratia marcescens]|nr:hypothetical protein DMW52_02760 [Serratia marcescens]PYA88104.1 hypothetical protein DMW54_11820 [Serratia marcescens]